MSGWHHSTEAQPRTWFSLFPSLECLAAEALQFSWRQLSYLQCWAGHSFVWLPFLNPTALSGPLVSEPLSSHFLPTCSSFCHGHIILVLALLQGNLSLSAICECLMRALGLKLATSEKLFKARSALMMKVFSELQDLGLFGNTK